ncbi:MAG TPA: hypothetical protein VN642_09710, partial [Dongiaceae bacterium]|nr:hypothetical protein [Dongiaceae bacterium]
MDLRYSYLDHESTQNDQKRSNALHSFKESYNISLAAAVYDPHIFDTTLHAGIVFDQNRSRYDTVSSSDNAATYQYNFSGSGLDRSPTPFTLLSYRDLNMIESTYALPYTSENSGNEVDFAIRNGILPSRFHLARITIDTRGGGNDSSSVSNSYSYSAEHKYKDLSATVLQLIFADQTGRSSGGADVVRTSNSLTISNTLSPGEQKKYSLLTWFNLYNSRSATFPQRTIDFRETLLGQLGKALSLEVVGALAKSRSTDDSGVSQESTTSRGEATLRHKLFSSVETTLNGSASSNNTDGGTEDRYSGRAGIRYIKHLPKSSLLSLGVTKDYELVDRKINSATIRVTDELHSGVHQGDVINLPLNDATLISVVSVKGRNPDVTYDEHFDYNVNIPF